DEARSGHLYTALQFAEAFENKAGLGRKDTIRERVSVLATKGFIQFVPDGTPSGLPTPRAKFGDLRDPGLSYPAGDADADAEPGQIVPVLNPVLPTLYKCPRGGGARPVENPTVWVYPEGVE